MYYSTVDTLINQFRSFHPTGELCAEAKPGLPCSHERLRRDQPVDAVFLCSEVNHARISTKISERFQSRNARVSNNGDKEN